MNRKVVEKMEKEGYERLEMEVILLETEDVILTSITDDGKTAQGTIFDSDTQ